MMNTRWLIPILCCVLAAAGPLSPARAQNRPASPDEKDYCAICHGQLEMEKLKKPVAEWRKSVHAAGGKRCPVCHGGNPGLNDRLLAHAPQSDFRGKPDRKASAEFCGREGCHTRALGQFKRGPHYQSVLKSGEPGCVTCHGAHSIQRSSIDVISEKSCTACHSAGYSRDMVKLIGAFDGAIGRIEANIAFLADKHADVKDLRGRLDNTRHLFHQLVHVFSREDMETTRKILDLEIASLDSETKSMVQSIQRIDILYLSMLVFGLAIIGGISTYTIIMYSKRKKSKGEGTVA